MITLGPRDVRLRFGLLFAKKFLVGIEFLNMRLVQLNPKVPEKTTKCVGSARNFAVKPENVGDLKEYIRKFIEEHTFSNDTGVACFQGISFLMDSPAFKWVKTEIMTLDQAEREAKTLGIEFLDNNAKKRQDRGAWCSIMGKPGD